MEVAECCSLRLQRGKPIRKRKSSWHQVSAAGVVVVITSAVAISDVVLPKFSYSETTAASLKTDAFSIPAISPKRGQRLGDHFPFPSNPPISLFTSSSSSALSVSFLFERTSITEDTRDNVGTSIEDTTAPPPAYVIERISTLPTNDKLFQRISDMCIDVFFKEQLTDPEFFEGENDPPQQKKGKLYPWKDWQIGYLKNLQAADLRRRRDRFGTTNEMFLAYEVEVAAPTAARAKPLVLDTETIYNVNTLLRQVEEKESCYVRGKLLGFVEITQRPYGIGSSQAAYDPPHEIFINADGSDDETTKDPRPLRPLLTNLAVAKGARKYGIGSKLLDACEQHVRKQWKLHEIILEVEDYNSPALKFYMKRGYHVLFSDPASRRYDVQGLWLRKIRCRREVLRKALYGMDAGLMESGAMNLLRRMRDGWR